MARIAEFGILCGENSVGKSQKLKELLEFNGRNLIIAADRSDSTWDDVKEIDVEKILFECGFDEFDELFVNSKKDIIINAKKKFKNRLKRELSSFKGNRKIFIEHIEIFKILLTKKFGFRNGGFIWDDSSNYIDSGRLPGYIKNYIGNRRFASTDIWTVFHSPTEIPPKMFVCRPVIYLFRTSDSFKRAKNNFPKYNQLIQMQSRINKITETDRYYLEVLE